MHSNTYYASRQYLKDVVIDSAAAWRKRSKSWELLRSACIRRLHASRLILTVLAGYSSMCGLST